jgi:hypothetical protein
LKTRHACETRKRKSKILETKHDGLRPLAAMKM